MDNRTITRSSLNKRQYNSLLKLSEKVETTTDAFITISEHQFKAIQTAFAAIQASGNPIPPAALAQAKSLGLVV